MRICLPRVTSILKANLTDSWDGSEMGKREEVAIIPVA